MALQPLGKYLLASVAKILLIHSLQNPYLTQRLLRVPPLAYSVRGRGRWLLVKAGKALKDHRGSWGHYVEFIELD